MNIETHFTITSTETTCLDCGIAWPRPMPEDVLIEHYDTRHNWEKFWNRSIPHYDEPKELQYQPDTSRLQNGTWSYER